jgi:hypothetical protein
MDMALYALLQSNLEGQTECKLWNGFKIEVVKKLPEKQIPNTIYFVVKEEYINTTHDGDIIVDHDGNTIIF